MELSVKYNEKQLENLRQNVKLTLSEKRYTHTLGVERAALRLAGYFSGLDVSELSAAALLHDITKELTAEEHIALALSLGVTLSDEQIESREILHSVTAPYAVIKSYPEFASDDILSSLKNHTTAAAYMSLFDEIIYIADYVEDGRTYPVCVEVRDMLFSGLDAAENEKERSLALHRATLKSLENTINKLLFQGRILNERTEQAREHILGLLLANGE